MTRPAKSEGQNNTKISAAIARLSSTMAVVQGYHGRSSACFVLILLCLTTYALREPENVPYWLLESLEDIDRIPSPIVLVVIIGGHCAQSRRIRSLLPETRSKLQELFQRPEMKDQVAPELAVLNWKDTLHTDGDEPLPHVFVSIHGMHQTTFSFASDTSDDLVRLLVGHHFLFGLRSDNMTDGSLVMPFDDLKQVQAFVTTHYRYMVQEASIEPTLPINNSTERIRWMMRGFPDDFVVAVQCRRDGVPNEHHAEFEHAASAVIRRDRFYASVRDCSLDGAVDAWRLPVHEEQPNWDYLSTANPSHDDLTSFLSKMASPTVLWFEQRMAAPIVVTDSRPVQTLLFIDLDNDDHYQAVQIFQEACFRHRRSMHSSERDMPCLVVPSSEIRVWSTLNAPDEKFPTVMVTDARHPSKLLQRFYLDDVAHVDQFFQDFWSNKLTPVMRSSGNVTRINSSGVRFVTGATIATEVTSTEHHGLLLFTSPTCGHSKRLGALWNELSKLVDAIGWDDFLRIYRMDATTDETLSFDFAPQWLPEIVYLPPSNPFKAVRFNYTDMVGDKSGHVQSPVKVLEFLIREGEFTDTHLRSLLESLGSF